MTYGVLGEYDVSSIQRDVERSLTDVSKVGEKLELYKNGLNRRLSEIDSAFSSLERAMDERVRELQRNAGKTSGYSSYSSADSNIKSERRKIDQLLDRIKDDSRELENLRRQTSSARGDVLPKIEKLERSHAALAKELESERRKSKLASAAAAAAMAGGDEEDDPEWFEEKITELRESYECKISQLTDQYEKKIAALEKGNDEERFVASIKRLSGLLEEKKSELKGKIDELEFARGESSQLNSELSAEREKNQSLTVELTRERGCVANYKELLKKRTVARMLTRRCVKVERFVSKWEIWFLVGIFAICFAILFRLLVVDN